MSNLLTSLRKNRTTLQTLTLTDQPLIKKNFKQRHSAVTYLYLYFIGIEVSAVVFLCEAFINFCYKIKLKK